LVRSSCYTLYMIIADNSANEYRDEL
jgi:hypothetical protein